jgi:hypothetical protein
MATVKGGRPSQIPQTSATHATRINETPSIPSNSDCIIERRNSVCGILRHERHISDLSRRHIRIFNNSSRSGVSCARSALISFFPIPYPIPLTLIRPQPRRRLPNQWSSLRLPSRALRQKQSSGEPTPRAPPPPSSPGHAGLPQRDTHVRMARPLPCPCRFSHNLHVSRYALFFIFYLLHPT